MHHRRTFIADGLADAVIIDPLMVDPRYHRQGVGMGLIAEVLPLAQRAVVATASDNAPARRLYESRGFVDEGAFEPVQGLRVSRYCRERPA